MILQTISLFRHRAWDHYKGPKIYIYIYIKVDVYTYFYMIRLTINLTYYVYIHTQQHSIRLQHHSSKFLNHGPLNVTCIR